jgi:hypothetical protein
MLLLVGACGGDRHWNCPGDGVEVTSVNYADGGTNTISVCTARCESDADCRAGLICMPTLEQGVAVCWTASGDAPDGGP